MIYCLRKATEKNDRIEKENNQSNKMLNTRSKTSGLIIEINELLLLLL